MIPTPCPPLTVEGRVTATLLSLVQTSPHTGVTSEPQLADRLFGFLQSSLFRIHAKYSNSKSTDGDQTLTPGNTGRRRKGAEKLFIHPVHFYGLICFWDVKSARAQKTNLVTTAQRPKYFINLDIIITSHTHAQANDISIIFHRG